MNRFPIDIVALVFALFAVYLAFVSDLLLLHHDLGWHLEAGRVYRQQGVITTEPWAWTSAGAPWVNLSYGWDIGASLLVDYGGYLLLTSVFVVVGAALPALIAANLLARGVGAIPTVAVSALAGITLVNYALPDVPVSASPQTWTLLLACVTHLLAWWAVAPGRPVRVPVVIGVLPVLLWVWANSHGAYLAGYVLLGSWFLDAVVSRDSARWRPLAIACALAGGLLFVNPLGPGVLEAIFTTVGGGTREYISEWRPFTIRESMPGTLWLLLFVFGAGWWDRRASWADLLVAGFWLWMGMSELRHFALFVVFSAPLVGIGLQRVVEALPQALSRRVGEIDAEYARLAGSRVFAGVVFAAVLVGVAPLLAWRNPGGVEPPRYVFPYDEVELVASKYADRRLFNDWNYGGFVIGQTHGRVRVFIDGRAGSAYPIPFLDDYRERYIAFEDPKAYFDEFGIEVILIANGREHVTDWLDQQPEWVLERRGQRASVYVRR